MNRVKTVSDQSAPVLRITDTRTNKTVEIPIYENEAVRATEFKDKLKLKVFDPGFMNTASCISRISYIDGDAGILRYRGIPIEELAEKSNFTETAFLLLYGHLPSAKQLTDFASNLATHSAVHLDMSKLHEAFRYDAHPMGMFVSAMAALGTMHPEQNPALTSQDIYKSDLNIRNKQIYRILGSATTIAAMAYRHRMGRPYNLPNSNLSYTENFLYMLDTYHEGVNYRPHPKLVKALDTLFLLHAEHELNCSTAAMRHLASSGVDVYTAVSAAAGALYGPRHGGANEAVVRMLEGITGTVDEFIEKVKNRKAMLMGFGHRIYKNYDPRAKIVRRIADEVFSVTGKEPLIEIAMELEKKALADEYFVSRKLYPNVDYYSGLIYKAMGFPTDFFPILFVIPRLAGWLAHWSEFLDDPDNKIARPYQLYRGISLRAYRPIDDRGAQDADLVDDKKLVVKRSAYNRRRDAALAQVRAGSEYVWEK
jgi:citrate synthase